MEDIQDHQSLRPQHEVARLSVYRRGTALEVGGDCSSEDDCPESGRDGIVKNEIAVLGRRGSLSGFRGVLGHLCSVPIDLGMRYDACLEVELGKAISKFVGLSISEKKKSGPPQAPGIWLRLVLL